jgi:transposase
MLADALGWPLRFRLAPGLLADTAFDSRAFRDAIQVIGAEPVIPSNPTRKHSFQHDRHRYKLRNRIERCFNKLKHFRRLATRYDRRAAHFLAFIHLAAAMLWMPRMSIQPRAESPRLLQAGKFVGLRDRRAALRPFSSVTRLDWDPMRQVSIENLTEGARIGSEAFLEAAVSFDIVSRGASMV